MSSGRSLRRESTVLWVKILHDKAPLPKELRFAVSVEPGWKDVFPSRATLQAWRLLSRVRSYERPRAFAGLQLCGAGILNIRPVLVVGMKQYLR
jgi:hypothetical protein